MSAPGGAGPGAGQGADPGGAGTDPGGPGPLARLGGIALECRDPAALADFYRALTGWQVVYAGADWVSLGASADARLHLSFQRAPGHRPPRWPDPASSMQAHLHLRVADLDGAERRALALGAAALPHGNDPARCRVLADPAGHPFCLVAEPPGDDR